MGDITLYFNPLSQPSRATFALLLLGEVQSDFRVVEIGIDTVKPEYLEINPFGTVPSLLHDNLVIYESMSIMRYITRTQKGCAKYYPQDPKAQAEIDMYMDWHHLGMRNISNSFFKATAWRETKGKSGNQVDEKTFEELHQNYIKALDQLESIFLGGPRKFKFINNTSDSFSIADLMCLMELASFLEYNFDYAKWPNITQWLLTLFSVGKIRQSCEFLLGQIVKNVPKPNEIINKILS